VGTSEPPFERGSEGRHREAHPDKMRARKQRLVKMATVQAGSAIRPPLYTPEERARRDATRWTLVQGLLAPFQFVVFLISLVLVLRFLWTGEGLLIATLSVLAKTLVLYVIMVTGAVWEKVVFGRYLFAPAFFWEDVFSILVLALHTAYLAAVFMEWGGYPWLSHQGQMWLALAAYATYVINAAQFLLKLRAARLDAAARQDASKPALVSDGMAEGVAS
jgi:3-vinyl bacteriochlorophyllide hydratase